MSNKIIITIAVVVVAGVVVFFSAQKDDTTIVGAALSTTSGVDQETGLAVEYAPDFTLDKLGGGTISLADYRGVKPVVLDFWASWCPNCRRDMPRLNKMYEEFGDEVEVVGVNLHEQIGVAQQYITEASITFPIALDKNGKVSNSYGIQYTNTHVLINKAGEVVKIIPGDIKESDVTSLIQEN